ncbi:MAG: glutamyl-tRNA reductase [Gammaproteobacteria bacterium]|nr:glutamyl-tRNA reductase [Gammaproteobacteria bacterium]
MSLLILGVNHASAPIQIREHLAIADQTLPQALRSLTDLAPISEAAIISTCNRIEIYCSVDSTAQGEHVLTQWLSDFKQLAIEQLQPYLYSYSDEDVAKHLFRVGSGLDSMVLGEPQILGQLKQAYTKAADAETLGKDLNQLFQQCFNVAKKVRTHTAIGANPVSVASTAVSLAKQIFADLGEQRALFIGAGETIELAAQHMHANGTRDITIANRSLQKAQQLSKLYQGQAIELADIHTALPNSDIVITATASQLPILGKGLLEQSLKQRKHKPILVLDLAIPRDVEPEAAQLRDIYLYSVDDLQKVIQQNMQSRTDAAARAEGIIQVEVDNFFHWLRGQDASEVIRRYREEANQQRELATEKALRSLKQGKSAEEALQQLGTLLTNKLLHKPTEAIKAASAKGQSETIRTAKTILGIDDE